MGEFCSKTSSAKSKSNNAVIYTRVSTAKQVDNTSLDFQLQECKAFCIKRGFPIIREFGGTHESAKFDLERKEFKKMIDFAEKKSNNIQHIVVYSVDRFSRSGGSAMALAGKLISQGISLHTVTQGSTTGSSGSKVLMDFQFLCSNFENEQRKEKIVAGMTQKLVQGYTMGNAPIGYSKSLKPGMPEPNGDAKHISAAFRLKEQGFTHDQICKQLKLDGFTIGIKRLTDIFKNPFYCGYVYHKFLDYEPVKGKHTPIISEERFINVNSRKIKYSTGSLDQGDPLPLKGFVVCANCGTKWTGYRNKVKGINYYKCNKAGCKANKNATAMHRELMEVLQGYKMPPRFVPVFKEQLRLTFHQMNENRRHRKGNLENQLNVVNQQIAVVKTNYATNKIPTDVYEVAVSELGREKHNLTQALAQASEYLSNLGDFIEFSVSMSQNLAEMWDSGPSELKTRLQYLLFPGGINYDRNMNVYRTEKVNGFFEVIRCLSETYKDNREKLETVSSPLSGLVVPTRIELVSRV